MLAELASSQACAMIRGGFHGLRAPDHPEVVTGVLWIRECQISNVGPRVKFYIGGDGWSWVEESQSRAGGKFAVRQYVRFRIAATIRGEVDVAYDRTTHVASLWFTPDKTPELSFKTIGGIDVDSKGVWSSVVGAIGSAFATSPEDAALDQTKSQGTRSLSAQLADGFAVTINLCTGLRRARIGHPPRGEMGAASVGETRRVFVDVEPEGVILSGPQLAGDGMTLRATATGGAAKLSLVCAKHANTVAAEFVDGRPRSNVPTLGSIEVRGQARLAIGPTICPVVVVVSAAENASTRVAWERPTAEIAGSTGGSLIHCPANKR